MAQSNYNYILIFILCFSVLTITGFPKGDIKKDIYDPGLNVEAALKVSLETGKRENKSILLMFGANWCPWCHRLNTLFETDTEIRDLLKNKYILIKVDIGETAGDPLNRDLVNKSRVEGFGFPSLAVIDPRNGQLIAAQSTGILEKGKGHNRDKVLAFLKAQTLD